MSLIKKILGKHKLKKYSIIEYDNGDSFRICCALNKGKRDYYDFERNKIVYYWDVTFARSLSIYTTIHDDKLISNEEAQALANENLLWFKNQLKHSKISKEMHNALDYEEI